MILLNSNLNNLLSNLNDDDDKKIKAIENQFLENFPGRIKALSDALNAEEVTINNIPDEIYKRWVSDEKYLIKILPKEDLNNNISMRNFVYQLQDFNKDVIGSPIISIEAGNAVKSAFKLAFLCAFIVTTVFFTCCVCRYSIICVCVYDRVYFVRFISYDQGSQDFGRILTIWAGIFRIRARFFRILAGF